MSELVHFACPQCHHAYKVRADMAGRQTRCRKCGKMLTVPAPTTRSAPVQQEVGHDRDSPLAKQIRHTLQGLIDKGKGAGFHWDDLLASCQPAFLADLETRIDWNPGENPGTDERASALQRTAREHLLTKLLGHDLCIKGPDQGMYAIFWLTPVAEVLVGPIPRHVDPPALLKSIQNLKDLGSLGRMRAAKELAAHGPAAAPAVPALLDMAIHDLPGGQWAATTALASIGEPAIAILAKEIKSGNAGRCANWTPQRTTFADQGTSRFRATVCAEVLAAIGTPKAQAILNECRNSAHAHVQEAVAAVTQERAAAIQKAAAEARGKHAGPVPAAPPMPAPGDPESECWFCGRQAHTQSCELGDRIGILINNTFRQARAPRCEACATVHQQAEQRWNRFVMILFLACLPIPIAMVVGLAVAFPRSAMPVLGFAIGLPLLFTLPFVIGGAQFRRTHRQHGVKLLKDRDIRSRAISGLMES